MVSSPQPAPFLRPARVADSGEIARIHVECWRAAYRGLVSDSYLNGLDIAERAGEWVSLLEASGQQLFVAEREAEPSLEPAPALRGFFQLGKSRDSDMGEQMAELWLLYVEPQSWRQGLGRLLLRRAIELARASGFEGLCLWMLSGRVESHRFYLSQGFRAERESVSPCWREAPNVATRRYLLTPL